MFSLLKNNTFSKKSQAPAVSGVFPLSMVRVGTTVTIQKFQGKDEMRRFLETLGFVPGEVVSIVSELGDNFIIQIKESRVAISKSVAHRIYIAA